MEIKSQYKSLVESLLLLASSYEQQQSYLPDFVIVQDEVVGTFYDAFLLLPEIIEAGLLEKSSIASILRCFNWIDVAIRNEDTSNTESFKSHDIWHKVRHLADQALIDMKESKKEPDLSHINWID